MATPTVPVSVAADNLREAAFRRLNKALLRRRTLTLFTSAIERDAASAGTPSGLELAKRSAKVLEYMRGYVVAVDNELAEATAAYDLEAYKSVRKARRKAN